jgi:hypothetical protein
VRLSVMSILTIVPFPFILCYVPFICGMLGVLTASRTLTADKVQVRARRSLGDCETKER